MFIVNKERPMSTAAQHSREGVDRVGVPTPLHLDALLDLDVEALQALYRGGRVPKIEDVSGDLRGRMLASPHLHPRIAKLTRAFAGTAIFPWRGKSFRPLSDGRGEGINRVFTDTRHWFRFETYIGKSRAGDFDALHLDYDRPGNPFFIRAIKDEIREIGPGLYLGQAYLQVGGGPRLALYFGLSKG